MSDRKGSTCKVCGKAYHCCSGCDIFGEDWLWNGLCSSDCADKDKIEWARQTAAKLGITPEQVIELADEAIHSDWSPY